MQDVQPKVVNNGNHLEAARQGFYAKDYDLARSIDDLERLLLKAATATSHIKDIVGVDFGGRPESD